MNDTTSPLVEEASACYRELLRPVFEGRKFLVAGPVAVGLGGLARQLLALGADRPFVIAGNAGTGAVPAPEEAELRVLGRSRRRHPHRAPQPAPGSRETARGRAKGNRGLGSGRNCTVRFRRPPRQPPPGRRPPKALWGSASGIGPGSKTRSGSMRSGTPWASRGHRLGSSPRTTAHSGHRRRSWTGAAAPCGQPMHGKVSTEPAWDCAGFDPATTAASPSHRCRGSPTGSGSCHFSKAFPASIHGVVFPDTVAVFRPVEMVVFAAADR